MIKKLSVSQFLYSLWNSLCITGKRRRDVSIYSKVRKSLLTALIAYIFIASFAINSTIAYTSNVPKPKQQYFGFYVLGENREYGDYYPNNDWNISPNTTVHWYLGVIHPSGTPQRIIVKAKLGNLTLPSPGGTTTQWFNETTNLSTLIEFRTLLHFNETWEIPFTWKIVNIDVKNDMQFLTLNINNKTITVHDVGAKDGQPFDRPDFRFIFELWTPGKRSSHIFSENTNWRTRGERAIASLYIWFRAAT